MTFEKVKNIIVDKLGLDEEEVTLKASLIDDLGVDSLEIFEIIMSLEDEFDIEIPNEDIEQIKIVEDVVKYIDNRLMDKQ